ncbi:hypothetical protein LXA47_31300 [Massilia sp. P8910]|uniref:hypothetical protein n=1 Tax=Massilia antarctica TaxID=2765360 RepID=UPI001E56A9D5|nr:hypothetical protein [Massilia antarctica]MCE3608058.1 hypothetical protein [Massilia antarctica]
MTYTNSAAVDQRPQPGFPSKQQLREADALAFAKRHGVRTAADLLQEQEEFRAAQEQAAQAAEAAAAAAIEAARPNPRKSCKELAKFVKSSALVIPNEIEDDFSDGGKSIEIDDTDLKAILITMLGKIHCLEQTVAELDRINVEQAELLIKMCVRVKKSASSYPRTFDSAGS